MSHETDRRTAFETYFAESRKSKGAAKRPTNESATCRQWCGDSAKCLASPNLPEWEADPWNHLTKAIWHLLSVEVYDLERFGIRSHMKALIAIRDAIHCRPAVQAPAVQDGALPKLLDHHAALLEHNSYAYFELAYTRSTGWMAWITDKPAKGEPGTAEYARSRKVIARGQGDTPEEAAADALSTITTQEGAQS